MEPSIPGRAPSRPPALWIVNISKPGTHERHPTAPCQQTKSISSETSLTGKCLSSPRSQQKVPFNSVTLQQVFHPKGTQQRSALSSHTERSFLLLVMFVLLTPQANILHGIVKDDNESNISRERSVWWTTSRGAVTGFLLSGLVWC